MTHSNLHICNYKLYHKHNHDHINSNKSVNQYPAISLKVCSSSTQISPYFSFHSLSSVTSKSNSCWSLAASRSAAAAWISVNLRSKIKSLIFSSESSWRLRALVSDNSRVFILTPTTLSSFSDSSTFTSASLHFSVVRSWST